MNIKLRLKNKTTLIAIVAATVAFLYQIAGILGIVPPISQEALMQGLGAIINLLAILGILVDPTTVGVKDSARAMSYEEPSRVTIPDGAFPAGGEYQYIGEEGHEANDPEDPEA